MPIRGVCYLKGGIIVLWFLLIIFCCLFLAQTQPTVTFANGSCTSIDSNASNPSTLSVGSKDSEIHIREKDGTESLDDYKCHARCVTCDFSR